MKKLCSAVALLAVAGIALAEPLTEAHTAALFKKADPDNDGTVDRAEAKKVGITEKSFRAASQDGKLDSKEFTAALTKQFGDTDGTLDWKAAQSAGVRSKAAFDAADPDKDGTLDPREYVAALFAQMNMK